MANEILDGTKADFVDDQAIARSVIVNPPSPSKTAPVAMGVGDINQFFYLLGAYADEITPWGIRHKQRDIQLRNFITQENIFASALGIICSRNSGFSWTLDGPARTVNQLQYALETANQGKGWGDLIVKTSIDLYTQDNGAFWEIVRAQDRPDGAFLGINHLDSARCLHTGDPKNPVIYQDIYGRLHLLPWYSVIEIAEMPAAIEHLSYYGLQYSTLTRILRKMQITKNVDVYDYERTGGRNTRAIHMVKGITTQQLTDAIAQANALADNQGRTRAVNPVVVGTIDPKADVGHDTINLVDLPDKYDVKEAFNQYINLIAMGFESDYQEFAPLPGGGLGTGAQSEMLHLKSRGKGPATFMKLITHALNFRVMPSNVVFKFKEQDFEAELSDANVRLARAQTRAVRITSGEITTQVARQLANDSGDLPEELINLMGETDLTTDISVTDETQLNVPKITPAPNAIPAPDAAPNTPKIQAQLGNNTNYTGSQKEESNPISRIKNRFFTRNREYERKSQKIDLFGLEDAVEALADENSAVVQEVLEAVRISISELKEENAGTYEGIRSELGEGLLLGLKHITSALVQSQENTNNNVTENIELVSNNMSQNLSVLDNAIKQLTESQQDSSISTDKKIKSVSEQTKKQTEILEAKLLEESKKQRELFEARVAKEIEKINKNRIKRVRKEVIRTDPNDPKSPIKEVIEHYE